MKYGTFLCSHENYTMEIDFVFQSDKAYPIEFKAEQNLKAKNLSTVLKNNENLFGIRFSMADYKEQNQMLNVPLPCNFSKEPFSPFSPSRNP